MHGTWPPRSPSREEENLILEFRDGVFLYVPASRIDLVQKYVGGQQAEPELSKLGGTAWGKKKDKVAEAVRDMAAEMIQLQAVRQAVPGFAFPARHRLAARVRGRVPLPGNARPAHGHRRDQGATWKSPSRWTGSSAATSATARPNSPSGPRSRPSTTASRSPSWCPTTVLAEQHYRTFSAAVRRVSVHRRGGQPLQERRRSRRRSLKRVAEGGIDVIIGTHRLLSKDVKFKDLGLVIIDEEQRFGVEHKERLKQLRATVDVLTMTATPIPRTLHLSLLGIRDISNLETPPPDRLPVETRIIRWDDQLIRHAILRELNRDGQVYFVHNRVHDIHEIAAKVQKIVPEAQLVVGHGQMDADELEKAMVDVRAQGSRHPGGDDDHRERARHPQRQHDLHRRRRHLRPGRPAPAPRPRRPVRSTGRMPTCSSIRSSCLTPTRQRRLKAIEEFTELGAGFKIAMRDLEIRGAGNILGTEQSGHIAAVGYELYCQLLENAVRPLKHQPPRRAVEVNVDLPWPAFLPRDYVPGQKLRIEVYRRLARLRDLKTLDDFRQELRDRYGPPPEAGRVAAAHDGDSPAVRPLADRQHPPRRPGPDLHLPQRRARRTPRRR